MQERDNARESPQNGTAQGRLKTAAAGALERAVLAESADASRITVVEDFLRRCPPRPDENVASVAEIVYAVAGDRTILKVKDLVDRARSRPCKPMSKYSGAFAGAAVKRAASERPDG